MLKNKDCKDPQCWCHETPEERAARELKNDFGPPNHVTYRPEWDSPFKQAYHRERKVESRLPLAIAWTAILVIIVLGVLGLILP